jgi:hypothetical protein
MNIKGRRKPTVGVSRNFPLLRWALGNLSRPRSVGAPNRWTAQKARQKANAPPEVQGSLPSYVLRANAPTWHTEPSGPFQTRSWRYKRLLETAAQNNGARTLAVGAVLRTVRRSLRAEDAEFPPAYHADKTSGILSGSATDRKARFRSLDNGPLLRPAGGTRYERPQRPNPIPITLAATSVNIWRRPSRRAPDANSQGMVTTVTAIHQPYATRPSVSQAGALSPALYVGERAPVLHSAPSKKLSDTKGREVSRPTGGTIYLDGYRLGSWVSNHFERAAALSNRSHGFLSPEDDVITRLYTTGSSLG